MARASSCRMDLGVGLPVVDPRGGCAMAGKIFVNYRRDDDPSAAARIRDGLAARFGTSNVYMDVDSLLAGQRFDEELAKALAQCDVVIAVVGARWMELLKVRRASGEFDYVREEIAEALRRKLVVIPVRVGREGNMPPIPRIDELPRNIREIVLHQKHDVTHERFARDMEDLANAITIVAKRKAPQRAGGPLWRSIGIAAVSAFAIGYAALYYAGVPLPFPGAPTTDTLDAKGRVAAKRREAERPTERITQGSQRLRTEDFLRRDRTALFGVMLDLEVPDSEPEGCLRRCIATNNCVAVELEWVGYGKRRCNLFSSVASTSTDPVRDAWVLSKK
jgi:hypothetical protein